MDNKALAKQFASMALFLKKKTLSKYNKNKLNSLPCVIVLGQPESGKSSLLKHSEQKFIFSKKHQPEEQQTCAWSVTRELTFLDIPGKYLLTEDKSGKTLWKTLCRLITKYHTTTPLGGIIIVIDAHDLYHRGTTSLNKRLTQIKNAIKTLNAQYKKTLPIHIILNKMDLIPGFSAFFNDLSLEDRQQTWGFLLGNEKDEDKLTETLNQEFNLLIKQLNQNLITHLHHSSSESERTLIKGFPLQVEKLKEAACTPLAKFIAMLNQLSYCCVNGIYLTSCQQHTIPDGDTENTLTKEFHRNYFTKQSLEYIVTLSHHQPRSRKKNYRKTYMLSLALSATLIAGTTYYLVNRFSHHIATVTEVENIISSYHVMQQQGSQLTLTQSETLLTELKNAKEQLNKEQQNAIINYLLPTQDNKIIEKAQQTYQDLLTNTFLPAVTLYLAQELKEENGEPEKKYIALEIYLMLNKQITLNLSYITNHIPDLLNSNQQFTATNTKQTLYFITESIQQAASPKKINKNLVAKTQQELNDLPANELAYVLLYANTGSGNDINISTLLPGTLFTLNSNASVIPPLYTGEMFNQIYPNLLNTISHEVQFGNSILGERTPIQGLSEEHLQQQLDTFYLEEYASRWTDALSQIHLKPSTSWDMLRSELAQLSSIDSPILYLIQTVDTNTNFEALNNKNELVELNKLINNLTSPKASPLFQIFKAMQGLSEAIPRIQENKQHAFEIAKAYATGDQTALPEAFLKLQTLSGQVPAPLRQWLSQILSDTWKLLLNDARDYINDQWKNQILDPFHSQIAEQYPFKKDAKQEVSFQQLNQFFGNKGTLSNFENNFITPFVNTDDGNWEVKPEYDSVLSLPEVVSKQLKRYAIIQSMFYGSEYSTLHTEFTLDPQTASTNTQQFNLIIGKQNILYNTNTPNPPITLAWPTSTTDHSVSLNFITTNGQHVSKKYEGDWAWMKVINEYATSSNSVNDHNITLNFDIGSGANATYILNTHGIYNPFDINFIDKTWMPHWIFQKTATRQ